VGILTMMPVRACDETSASSSTLKVCRADDCRWLYYDRSPGNNSLWCSMNICGARHKTRTYRRRRKDP
jgi:predicted RNA-binding Zn ribbon-like protein